MSPGPKLVHLTVRMDQSTVDAFRDLVAREERTVSQDIRLYIQKRLDRAEKDAQKAQAA